MTTDGSGKSTQFSSSSREAFFLSRFLGAEVEEEEAVTSGAEEMAAAQSASPCITNICEEGW